MRIFHLGSDQFVELEALPAALPEAGFVWVGVERREFERSTADLQAALLRWELGPLVDLHVSDLLNAQLPSHFDYTSWYDMLVFRRLATSSSGDPHSQGDSDATPLATRQTLASIDTSPVGFVVFDRLLITVHPADCAVREHFALRLATLVGTSEARTSPRLPTGSADLMLRMVNHMVDSYLDLRRLLTRQLGHLQQQLLAPHGRFADWHVLLESRTVLHSLEDICDDQRGAVLEWTGALIEWPAGDSAERQREIELLRVRSRDVLEHVERVLSHVRRLQNSAEAAVQLHFSALGYRTNNIIRTLTVLTAVFLPLNLITGFFGMNFDFMPLVHTTTGLWLALAVMVTIGLGLLGLFWRKRYLGSQQRP